MRSATEKALTMALLPDIEIRSALIVVDSPVKTAKT